MYHSNLVTIMKKNIYKISIWVLLALSFASSTGCSDDFLAEKRPYGEFGPDQIYNDWTSVKLRLNYLYQKSLPYAKGYNLTKDNYPPDLWPVGLPDLLSKNTDEFTGFGEYNDSSKVWTSSNIHKYFFYGINESPWKKMRECTEVIVNVNKSTTLTDDQKALVEGQARFLRATRYFRLFKRYGGLPVIRGLQSTLSGDRDSLAVSRKSTKATFDFIIEDLTYGGEHLPARWPEEANDWGRITAGAAYAMAGIVANYYASPVFNRADDQTRWEYAYNINKKALEKLAEGNFGLSYEGDPGVNASKWASIWCDMKGGSGFTSEAVYIALCNNAMEDNGLPNCWEQTIRPGNSNGGGGIVPSAQMVDLFPMADGKRPSETGTYMYDKKIFFLNRDPRFYRTFSFPGVEWKFNGSISAEKATQCPYLSGSEYKLMNFAWYRTAEDALDPIQSGYFTDLLGSSGSSVYVRKKSQDYSFGMRPLYVFQNDGGFALNGQPLIAIRYAEVLLNFAEAACGANHLNEAWDALVKIRQRVGYTGDCGLNPAIQGDRARMFEAILYERSIELAYEGKRFDDCHRWMLFDGGVGQEQIYSAWQMTGWNGNTCAYLGVTPLNNIPRQKIELYFDPSIYIGEKTALTDPFTVLGIAKPKALTLNEKMTTTQTVDGNGDIQHTFNNEDVKALAAFYSKYLIRKDISTMNSQTSNNMRPIWSKNLYFMGLQSSDQDNSPRIVQNVSWNSRFGGYGVFDPLSDNPVTEIERESGGVATP